ncbi:MAG: hypothetical protein R3C14_04155 [Caldilineaceae bacterium]
MFAYTLPSGLPAGSRTVWSQIPLQPWTATVVTPFSYSILEEVAKSAWYQYFDALGFAPMPRARVLRHYQGRVYQNLTLSAQRDAEAAAIEPLTLFLNGEPYPVAKGEKPGLLAGIKAGRNRKKLDSYLQEWGHNMATVLERAQAWHAKTQELRWTQADILQVMEEIERVGVPGFQAFFAARHNLERAYNRLLWLTAAQQPFPTNLPLIQAALCDVNSQVEADMTTRLLELGAMASKDDALIAWLQRRDYANWQTTVPSQGFLRATQAFLHDYGHRGMGEAEIRNLRWAEDPELIFSTLLAYTAQRPQLPAKRTATEGVSRLLAKVAPGEQKAAQQLLQKIHQLITLQSLALHALAYIWAGTRQWALAAAKEARADQRLQMSDDVFFFTLEEMKQMMTGEWNISARQEIQATCAQRRTAYAAWQSVQPAPLLIGDSEALVEPGLPGVGGQARGLLRCWQGSDSLYGDRAIIGTDHLDSGWSLVLPFVQAFVAADGAPFDPLVIAAGFWQLPTVLQLGADYRRLIEGAPIQVHGSSGQVEQ